MRSAHILWLFAVSNGPGLISASSLATSSFPRLYFLSLTGEILNADPEGGEVVHQIRGINTSPDGIAVDKTAGYLYWTNMGGLWGMPGSSASIQRVSLQASGTYRANKTKAWVEGEDRSTSEVKTLVTPSQYGGKVPKQMTLVEYNGRKKLYWGDREGMKVVRANTDGSDVEVVIDTSGYKCQPVPDCREVVGVAVDTKNMMVYWSQKGRDYTTQGSIHRAPINRTSPAWANDIQTILSGLSTPIDLHFIDGVGLFWTDRASLRSGDVNSLALEDNQVQAASRKIPRIKGLGESVGITSDGTGRTLWTADMSGNVWKEDLLGGGAKKIYSLRGAMLAGIVYVG